MRILALEPFYGGSHRAFLDSWIERSKHDFTLLTLPATRWKWRMRHAGVTFADEVRRLVDEGERWEILFATDMLNLAEFKGLAPPAVATLPSILYFHENQLTYPVREEHERDYHFAMSNIVSALAADNVWFNSGWHQDTFIDAARAFLARMPDHRRSATAEEIAAKSQVYPPGIEPVGQATGPRRSGPLRVLWSARWEHDKGPGDFFAAIERLDDAGVDFRLNVIGQRFAPVPSAFEQARSRFHHRIDRWGFIESRPEYEEVLRDSDMIVSTANHEFFGIAVLEAISAGCYPILPDRLSYPELLSGYRGDVSEHLYDGSVKSLVKKLVSAAHRLKESGSIWPNGRESLADAVSHYHVNRLVPQRDTNLPVDREVTPDGIEGRPKIR